MTRLEPGELAPRFTLCDDSNNKVSLSDFRGKKVILYVYPAAMTPGCTTQACDFRDSLEPFVSAGYAVLGLSPDTPEKLAEFREHEGLTFPLLADPDQAVLLASAPSERSSCTARRWLACSARRSSSTPME